MKLRVLSLTMASIMALGSFSFAATSPTAAGAPVIKAAPKLEGTVNEPRWLNAETLLVKVVTDLGFEYHKLSLNGHSELLIKATSNTTELAESPDGKKIAYVNDNGDVFLMELATQKEIKISSDNEPKMELQFSADGSKLYFLMGEKIDRVAVIQLSDQKLSLMVDDKVAYKSDLQISKDGTKAFYAVTKAGKVDEVNDAFTVDSKGTEPQYNLADLTAVAAKPVQLTGTTDNKIYGRFLSDNSTVFISADPDKAGMPLKQISADGKIKFLVSHLDVYEALITTDGSLLIVGESSSFKKSLFSVDANGRTKHIAVLPEGTSAVTATDLGHIAVTVDTDLGEKISVLNATVSGGKFVDLTK